MASSPDSNNSKTIAKNIDRFEVKDKLTCKFCLTGYSSKLACKKHEEICDKNPSSEEKPKFKWVIN